METEVADFASCRRMSGPGSSAGKCLSSFSVASANRRARSFRASACSPMKGQKAIAVPQSFNPSINHPIPQSLTLSTITQSPHHPFTRSLEREWRVIVHQQEQIRFDTNEPPQDTDAEFVEPLRVLAGEQNRQPRDERRDPPRDGQQPDDNQLRDDQDQTKSDAEAPARALRLRERERRRVRVVAERRIQVLEQHQVGERAHTPSQVEDRVLADRRDISAADHNKEPVDDREDVRHGAEQPGFAAQRGAGAAASTAVKGKPHSDAADEQQMRNRKNDAKRDRQPVAIGARRLNVDRDRVWHAPIISPVTAGGRWEATSCARMRAMDRSRSYVSFQPVDLPPFWLNSNVIVAGHE